MRLKPILLPLLLAAVPSHAALVSSWSIDELSGNISDGQGASPAGVATGTITYGQPGVPNGNYGPISVVGAAGTSLGFEAVEGGQYFALGESNDNPVLNIDRTGAFTVMSWINPLAPAVNGTYRPISTGGAGGGAGGWGIGLRVNDPTGVGSAIRFTTYAVADNDSDPFDIVFGEWVHIAATYDNGAIDYYLNGTLLGGSDNSSFNNDTVDARLTIGSRFGGNLSDQTIGQLDGVRIYDSVLSAGEIQSAAAASVVPEPAAGVLGLLGLTGLLARRRR